jgi:hypothetical protein
MIVVVTQSGLSFLIITSEDTHEFVDEIRITKSNIPDRLYSTPTTIIFVSALTPLIRVID